MNLKTERILLSLFSAGALLAAYLIRNRILNTVLVLVLLLVSLFLLYRHMPQLTDLSQDNPKVGLMRGITLLSVSVLVLGGVLGYLTHTRQLSAQAEQFWASGILLLLLVVLGNLAPKIPFNRYTGLRLPWTVRDEETWNLAHRTLGYLSFPLAVAYLIGIPTAPSLGGLSAAVILLWVGIPGLVSLRFYLKKYRR